MSYRAAVIGLGRMGSTFDDEIKQGGSIYIPYCHTPSYVANPRTQLVAGADPHDEQRSVYAERWGLGNDHVYVDYLEMLEKEKPEIVSISTTARIRPEIVKRCAESGVKAIWAEKPLAFSLAEADEMLEVCRKHNVVVAVNCARRWNPNFITARQLIDEGELGDIIQVTAYAACGLSHNGSHMLDTIRYLAGGNEKVKWVFGEMASDEAANDDKDLQGNGYLVFENGVRAFARSMSTGAIGWEFEVLGTKGVIRTLNNGTEFQWRFRDESATSRKSVTALRTFPHPPSPQGMGLTITNDILDCVENGGKPKCSGEDALAALEIAIAMRESHRRGCQKVDLPLEDRSLKILSAEAINDTEPAIIRRRKAAAAAKS